MQQIAQNTPELWVFKETMKYLRVSRSTLYRLMADGTVPAHKVGNTWRFYSDEVKAVGREAKPAEQGEQ